MKLKTAFKLSALAVALASTSAMAATLDTSQLGNDVWTDPRSAHVGNVDTNAYQYVDVGSQPYGNAPKLTTVVQNKLTEWYNVTGTDGAQKNYLKVTDVATSDVKVYSITTSDANKTQADWIQYFAAANANKEDFKDLVVLNAEDTTAVLNQLKNTAELKPILAGLTKETEVTTTASWDIKRLDSQFLEYADSTTTRKTNTGNVGNLTNDDIDKSLVLANVDEKDPILGYQREDRGVITGILNGKSDPTATRNYGVSVHATKTDIDASGKESITEEKSSVITENGIVVSLKTADKDAKTTIAAEGITTGSLTVDGVNVGQTLQNVSALGNLTSADINNLVNSGQTIATIKTDLVELDTKVDTEVARLDGRIDAELATNAAASTTYTDTKATETLAAANAAAKAEDIKTLAAADVAAKAEDVKTLASAKSYTDTQISTVNTRVSQLNKRVDDVEKTAYRGVAIALAAQQQVPNIKPGQYAVFGGVGHYEGESAVAFGLVGALNERTSLSAAIGSAGSEVGGRVGVAYVFGAK